MLLVSRPVVCSAAPGSKSVRRFLQLVLRLTRLFNWLLSLSLLNLLITLAAQSQLISPTALNYSPLDSDSRDSSFSPFHCPLFPFLPRNQNISEVHIFVAIPFSFSSEAQKYVFWNFADTASIFEDCPSALFPRTH